ncbi:hypothetical protein BP6252_05752 [Coleophoma cylindrospora]|uniref:C2H2-type domain-containing protein n=1 Tax=Coleophoma cylindrospora TaxID=1849047 RepID=A0A3D8RUE7_9HELO|nr:hypothetical protein BP6252_05752 [Coleophoma cylindrospora]
MASGHAQTEASPQLAAAPLPTTSKGTPKKYVCTFEGCTKAFTRSDHLQRHSLNHGPGKSTCPRCSVHFNRPDLLDRHLARHRQKDEEAGGEGLGVMETRKRMWRDADGNIVTKKPTLPHHAVAQQRRESGSKASAGPNANYEMSQNFEPLSPPRSTLSSNSTSRMQQPHISTPTVPISDERWASDGLPAFRNDAPDMCDFLANSSWGSQQGQPTVAMNNVPYDDMFNPDTASSFNMPFTTMNNYNWLFDVDSMGQDLQNRAYQQSQLPRSYPNNANNTFAHEQYRQPLTHEMLSHNGLPMSMNSGTYQAANHLLSMQLQGQTSSESMLSNSTAPSTQALSPEDNSSPGNFSGQYCPTSTSQTSVSEYQQSVRPPNRAESIAGLDPLQAFRPTSRVRNLPIVDEISRNQILDLITTASPCTPEGNPITRDHPLLSLSALQNYCDLFFCRFNVCYPLLHQPTFEPSQVETLLLLSVLLLGATYGDKAGHRLAVCIHDVMRAQIFQSPSFKAQPELWMLQTILLVECFGKSRAGQTQHDMSHLFHGLLINLIRRSDCQTVRQPNFDEDGNAELESNWKRFVDVEQRKRLALLCFLWDTQHAVLFSQSLCMSAFELRVSLPCNPTTWEADSAEEWWKNYRREIDTSFLTVLKVYVNPGSATPPHHLNALSRLLILHGLMSISWDMKRRDQTALGFVGTEAQERQTRLAQSYDAWKADFDTYCMSMAMTLKDNASLKREFTQFSTASIAIYHAAHIILNVEILDLQIYAGARHIIGRPVTRADYARSRRMLKQWVNPGTGTSAAVKASWHAAHLLRDGIMNLDNWDVNDVFHYPWCLYLATLTCWGFHFAGSDKSSSPSDGSELSHASGDSMQHDDIVWDAQAEMNALVSGMTSVTPEGLWRMVGKYPTGGLTAVMAKHLSSVRWAVIHEGMKVLRGLVAERSINEYERLLR